MWWSWLACTGPPGPPSDPLPLKVSLDPEQVWSAVDVAVDQHHATVVALPGAAGAAVSWTDGQMWESHVSRLLPLDPHGAAIGQALVLDGGGVAAKPDIDVDRRGRLVVAYQSDLGIELERVDLDPHGSERVTLPGGYAVAEGNNSVDVAVTSGGTTLLVWYEQDTPIGRYHTGAVDAALSPSYLLPETLWEVDDSGAATPDIEVDAHDRISLAWVDQHFRSDTGGGEPDRLMLDQWGADGAPRWSIELDRTTGLAGPRRATVSSDPDGRLAVGWRKRAEDIPTPSTARIGFVDVDGRWLREPFEPLEGNTDDIVVAMVGSTAVWVVWTSEPDPVEGLGTITGGLLAFPSGEWLDGPMILSDGATASRPHTDVARITDGEWRVVVSWEQDGADWVRLVRGRVGVISAR
ncbi:MAG: hypothetical protein ABMA64_39240 [Myxococcota bacterium]